MDDFFVRNRLSAYLDGELPAAEARAVESALARDPELRAEYERLRRAVDLLRTHGPVPAPVGFELRLQQRLAAEPMPVGWRRWVRAVRPEFVALGALAAAALLFVAYSPGSGEAPIAEVPVPVPTGPVAAEEGGELVGDDAVAAADPTEEGTPGVLGDEGFAAAQRDAAQKRASGPPPGASAGGRPGKMTGKAGVEKIPYSPDWEADPEYTVIVGDTIVQKATPEAKPGEAAAKPGEGAAEAQKAAPASTKGAPPAAQAQTQTLYSPPPFRYRVRSEDETNLAQLASIVASLGGRLVDDQGRAVAIHMLDTGEVRSVRVLLPASKVEVLTGKLRTLGDTEIMAAGATSLYAAGAEVPVMVELERE